MADRSIAGSMDEYIAPFPPETQQVLEEVRALVKAFVPDAVESISYGMPTFDLMGRHLLHFAGWKKHIGLYPVPRGAGALVDELRPFTGGTSSARFPLNQPLPTELIRRLLEFRVQEVTRTTSK